MRTFFLERSPEVRGWIAHGLVVAVPVAFLRVTHDPFGLPKLALLVIGVGVLAGLRGIELIQGVSGRTLRSALVPAAVLISGFVCAWIFTVHRSYSLFGADGRLQGLLPYVFFAAFGVLLADASSGKGDRLALAFVWSGAVVGGYAVIQTVGLDPFRWSLGGAPTAGISTIGNPNFTGGFLGMVLPVALGRVLFETGDRRRAFQLLGTVIAGWLAAQSQGGWAAGLAGCALVLSIYFRDRIRFARVLGFGGAVAIAAVTFGVVVLNIVAPGSRLAVDAFSARGGWWQAALGLFADSPIVGSGPEAFALEGVAYRPLSDALRFAFDFANDPHSVPLNMLANGGLVLFVAWGFVIGWFLSPLARRAVDARTAIFAAAGFAYLVQSLVSIDEISLRVGLWVAVAGVAVTRTEAGDEATKARVASSRKKGRPTSAPLRALPAVAVMAVASLAIVALGTTWLVADIHVRQGVNHLASGDVAAGQQSFERALNLRDSADYRGLLALELKEVALEDEAGEDRASYEASKEAFTSYIEDVPYVFSIASFGRLLDGWAQLNGDGGNPEAVAAFERARAIDPLNPQLRADLAAALNHLGRFEEAVDILEPFVDVVATTQYGSFWANLAWAAGEIGEDELAGRALEVALVLNPATDETQRALELVKRTD